MSATIALDEIPGPRGLPLVGNAFDIDATNPIEGFMEMAGEYGPIFRLSVPGGTRLIVSGADLVDELCDESRFDKLVGGGLANLRKGATDAGLFTADTEDPLWKRAHDILHAPFSLRAMNDYLPDGRHRRAAVDKWGRLNPDEQIDVTADMTRLTLDTIALCGFGYRFNSFYRDTQHPFVEAMMRTLPRPRRGAAAADPDPAEDPRAAPGRGGPGLHERPGRPADRRAPGAGRRGGHHRPARPDAHRRRQGAGQGLPDHNILAQCITFLIAGHETTSGPAVVRDLLPAQEPGGPGPGAGRGRRGARHRRVRPRSSRCTGSPTSARSSTSRCGCGRPHPGSPATPTRTP